jgi:hypothetical protein
VTTATSARRRALEAAGLVHPNAAGVTAALFDGTRPFFLAADKVQVKYEMLRAHVVDGQRVGTAAAEHGSSRAAFYLVAAAFDERGMLGLWTSGAAGAGRPSSPRSWPASSLLPIRACRAPSWPRSSAPASGCRCTGARSSGRAAGEGALAGR